MNKYQIHEKLNFTNMRELVEWAGETYADKYAYSFRRTAKSEITKIKFSSLREDVRSLACELSDMGCAGKHCAIIGKLSYDWVLTYFAVLSIGGVLVPLDPEWQQEDLDDTVSKAHASFLFCDEDIKEKGEYIAEQIKLEAEHMQNMSSKTIYAIEDRTNAVTSPSDTTRVMLNTVGGEKWQAAGQWIEFTFTTTEDGAEESTMILTGFHRGAFIDLETDKSKIKDHFHPIHGLRGKTDGGSIAVFFEGAFYVPTGEADLKRMQINLKIKEWKGV